MIVCLRLLYLIMVYLLRWLTVLACSESAVAAELLVLRVGCQKSVICPDLDIHVRR